MLAWVGTGDVLLEAWPVLEGTSELTRTPCRDVLASTLRPSAADDVPSVDACWLNACKRWGCRLALLACSCAEDERGVLGASDKPLAGYAGRGRGAPALSPDCEADALQH